ncbi:hypothetical protein ACFE04_022768 [Oxalis oulophora]
MDVVTGAKLVEILRSSILLLLKLMLSKSMVVKLYTSVFLIRMFEYAGKLFIVLEESIFGDDVHRLLLGIDHIPAEGAEEMQAVRRIRHILIAGDPVYVLAVLVRLLIGAKKVRGIRSCGFSIQMHMFNVKAREIVATRHTNTNLLLILKDRAQWLFITMLRRKSRSISPRRRKSRSPPRRHRSRSLTPKRNKRQRSKSSSLSPTRKTSSTSIGLTERKNAGEKLKIEVEEKKRRQQQAELKLIEEETAKRVEGAIQKKVEESLNSVEIRSEIQKRLDEGRKRLHGEVAAQLEKEKESAIINAQLKEEQAKKEKEELEKLLEENRRKVEEAQKREVEERLRKEEERYRELEELQRQKEEEMRRRKQKEEEERKKQMTVLGKNKSRPKLSFAIGSK